MDVPESEELTQRPYDDKKVNCDSYLSPMFFRLAQNCTGAPTEDKSRSRSNPFLYTE